VVRPRHVYVHVPFCARRCAYCDFSIAVRRDVPVDAYRAALRRELDLRFPELAGTNWAAETLYLGGGTPSRLGALGLARTIEDLRERIDVDAGGEITIEANPDDVTREAAASWRAAGVNRVSLGVQSFDDRVLRWMHRTHDADRARSAMGHLRTAGVDDVSIDLIFALPEELGRDWQRDLDLAVELEPTHLSLYGLTVEEHTPLHRWIGRGDHAEAPEERYESDFLAAHETLREAGMTHYEVSNFARPGRQARHNASYWRRVPYVGLGPSAHEFDGCRRRWNVPAYVDWAKRLQDAVDPMGGSEELAPESREAELVYLGLRTEGGLRLREADRPLVEQWERAGWAEVSAGEVRLTPTGWLRLDGLAAALLATREMSGATAGHS